MARRAPAVPQYRGSPSDIADAQRGAGLLGITPQQYEQTPMNTLQNAAGQQRLNRAVGLRAAANAAIAHHSGSSRKR